MGDDYLAKAIELVDRAAGDVELARAQTYATIALAQECRRIAELLESGLERLTLVQMPGQAEPAA